MPLTLPDPLPFLKRPIAARVMGAFADAGVEARFVGGCVRDALLRQTTGRTDLDVATPLPPEEATKVLEAAGLKVKPTGIAFGTITAILDGDTVEVTTLRRDIETDGRHAVVGFGTSWEEDAQRRDFTINALSVGADGVLHDYTGGVADLDAGLVRFIGDAGARIREDYLRILRFFRFHARFGRGEADPEALGAIAALKTGLAQLSAERVWSELGKLLGLPQPLRGILPMQLCGAFEALLPTEDVAGPADLDLLERYAAAEAHNDFHAVPVLRLAALLPDPPLAGAALMTKLKLSRREAAWAELAAETLVCPSPRELARVWYWQQAIIAGRMAGPTGQDWLINLAFLYAAGRARNVETVDVQRDLDAAITLAAGWTAPTLPLAAADLVPLGVESGPRMGEILDGVERWWVDRDFKPSHDDCVMQAKKLLRG